jgi:TetR/AcrR family tetracycline transcriptional repressor
VKGLSREVLIETGLRLLDEVGLDGLTVRRLAGELGVRSPALYWHIKTKQELLDGMADAIIQGAGMGPPRDGESWQEWLRRRARGYRRSLLAHRDGARVVASARRMPGALGEFEGELSAMVGLGFTPVLALRTITALGNYLNGYVLQEQAGVAAGLAAGVAAAGDPEADDLLAAMPTLATALRAGGNPMAEASFEHGLTLLIAGTEAQVMA